MIPTRLPSLVIPLNGPPMTISHVAYPTGLLLKEGRPYEPSWKMGGRLRTTWTDSLGGHFGLVGLCRRIPHVAR